MACKTHIAHIAHIARTQQEVEVLRHSTYSTYSKEPVGVQRLGGRNVTQVACAEALCLEGVSQNGFYST